MKSLLCIAINLLFFITTSLYAQTRTVSFYNFSTYKGLECEEFLKKTQKSLTQEHGITIKAGMCEWNESTRQTKITYLVKESDVQNFTSTHSLGNIYAARGLYVSQEICEQYLDKEALIFEKLTGLKPQVQYCSQSRLEQKWKWYANLSALNGTPARKPARTEWRSDTPHGISNKEILEKLSSRMAPLGMTPYAFRFRSSASLGRGTIHHYQPADQDYFNVQSKNLVEIGSLEKCKQVADQLESEISRSKLKPDFYLALCTSPYSNPKSFDVALVANDWSINTQYSSEKYTSSEECEASRSQVAENYDIINPGKLIATLCGRQPYSSSDKSFLRIAFIKNRY